MPTEAEMIELIKKDLVYRGYKEVTARTMEKEGISRATFLDEGRIRLESAIRTRTVHYNLTMVYDLNKVYVEMGYSGRKEYLDKLAEKNDYDPKDVLALATVLGPNEDFDALVTILEDHYA